jgi:uncharacterized protein (DUF1501 family)
MSESMTLKTRRDFLRTTALGSALTWTVPSFLAYTFAQLQADAADKGARVATGKDSTILVILQMAGGNDGLNTIVPYANDHYHKGRPRLGLREKTLLKINDNVAFNSSLSGLKALYDAGQLSVIQGIGYPNPNRSHFRSTEIWQTASDSQRFERYGWLGRYFDNACKGADPTIGINVGRQMPQAFAAKKPMGVSLEDPQSYRFMTTDHPGPDETASMEETYRELNSGASIGSLAGAAMQEGSTLDYVERTALDAQISSEQIRAASNKVENKADYPQGRLGISLKLVARLIGGGLPTRIYYVSQGGYDTHGNQANAHERLLRELGDSVKAFIEDITAQGNFDRVMLMTFSEFGRRLKENASGGTDHGAASVMFVAGNKIKPGLLGTYPSLASGDLHNGDPKFTTDFRSVYAAVLEQWLNTPCAPVLGRKFDAVKLLLA